MLLIALILGVVWSMQEGFRVSVDLDGSVLSRAAGLKEGVMSGVHTHARKIRDGMMSLVPFRAHYYKLRRRFR